MQDLALFTLWPHLLYLFFALFQFHWPLCYYRNKVLYEFMSELSDMLLLRAFVFFFSLKCTAPENYMTLSLPVMNWIVHMLKSLKLIWWSPNSSTSECNYIWRNNLLRSVIKEEAVKGGALIHMTDILIRREKSRMDVYAQIKVHVRTQQEASHLQAKERVFREKSNPLIHWSCLSSIQYYEKINLFFKPLISSIMLWWS